MLVMTLLPVQTVLASGGSVPGGSGGSGCSRNPYSICTDYGATWRWYSTEGQTDPNKIWISGRTDADVAAGYGKYAMQGWVKGCGVFGGYYRYAMVLGPAYGTSAGNQKGLDAIGTGLTGSWTFVSAYFGGYMTYQGPDFDSLWWGGLCGYYGPNCSYSKEKLARNLDWYFVESEFKRLRELTDGTPYAIKTSNGKPIEWNSDSGLTYFCGPAPNTTVTYTLTLIPIDGKDKKEIGVDGEYRKTVSATYTNECETDDAGKCVKIIGLDPREKTITADEYLPGYRMIKWGTSDTDTSTWWDATSFDYTTTIFPDKTIYAIYEDSAYEGQIVAESQSGVDSIGYTTESGGKVHEVKNCSSTDGCEVTFTHNLKRSGAFGGVEWEITRTSNYSDGPTGGERGKENFSDNPVTELRETIKLYPGQMVCEKLSFENGSNGGGKAELKICAMATGSAKAAVSLAVRNTNVNKYNEYQKLVYAKPNDKLDYKSVYRASPQYAYAMIPIKLSINNGTEYNNPMSLITGTLFDNKNGCNSSDKKENCWNNAFSVTGDIFSEVYVYTKGDSSSKEKHKEPIVSNSYVGKTLKEQAKINGSDTGKTTPSQVDLKISDDKTGTLAKVYTEGLESEVVTVIVPYNFIALAEVTTDSDKVFTAGEKNQSVNYKLDITKKNNAETTNGADEAYATVARDVKSKVIFYTIDKEGLNGGEYESDSLCGYFRGATSCDDTRQDKEHGELSSSFETSFQFDVPDVPAGSKICIAAAIYPSSSGADTNIDKSGSKKWRISDSKCFIIGKKPTFQVWGGSFYGGGKIATASTTKDELAGGIEIPSGKVMVFGSWVEQTVVARGEIIELASGASSGLLNSPVKGGSPEVSKNYCRYRTVLSLANYSTDSGYCPNSQKAGNSGIAVDRVKLEDFVEVTEKTDTDVDIYGKIINKGETYIVNTSKDVKIHNDIKYAANSYSELDELPKAFIAASNIYIDCGVKQIDAFLIADNIIKTCGKDQNDINDKDHSNQLVVNGAISAGNLKLDRTFGAATGSYSSIPAEIVNYDASIILWMRNSVDTEEYNKMHQVYQHELAPRY